METTRVLWSGLTGRTGQEALEQQANVNGVKIVAGISREATKTLDMYAKNITRVPWYFYRDIANPLKGVPRDYDVMVDFSHPDVFGQVLEATVLASKPLVSGTSGLSDRQMAMLYDATNHIPVFRGGNFRFKVKTFIDEAVELAQRHNGKFDLHEKFYEGKHLPSETAKVIQRRISEETGKFVEIHSSTPFARESGINDWELQVRYNLSPVTTKQQKAHCRAVGYDELAHNVLEIAKVMAKKPVQPGEFYDLDQIWGELSHN